MLNTSVENNHESPKRVTTMDLYNPSTPPSGHIKITIHSPFYNYINTFSEGQGLLNSRVMNLTCVLFNDF